ncbi:hypothetical protein [Lapillicoccus jejuensis]|uniref:Aminoglycoside-2''-adenylyltransferase n=1 Tax=Lapillicoccus jejuensis TaxID=402171 RepID=A0A542E3G3_9MICO|nr:hypothetical protein [Lapillicoccus jejuensis]TQJ09880.1 hypothetical protein FB458_2996 [Lapillicoccus jejuensis]
MAQQPTSGPAPAPRDFGPVDAAIDPVAAADPRERDFLRTVGPWRPWTLAEARAELASFDGPWWVCGGVAVEAFTGVARHHEDVDVAFFTRDLPSLRAALAPRYDLWSVGSHLFRLLDDVNPTLHEQSEQVWVRAHAWSPWRADLLATADADGAWVDKREPSLVRPLEDATWVSTDGPDAGVRYLRPELALAMKARLDRPKDRADLAAALPLLGDDARGWLRDAVRRRHPEHPWLARL